MILRDLLRVLGSSDRRDGRNLTHEEAFRAFGTIFDGEESEIRIGAFLIAMRWKGITVEELTGFARAARTRARIPCDGMTGLCCLCPPHDGADFDPPLEVAAGLVAAGAGARILLISDRGVPPRRGVTAGDVLDQMGAPLSWDVAEVENRVERFGFGSVAAPAVLPALLELRRVRSEVGVRTPLSTIEKLIAPSSASVVTGAQHGPVLGIAVETISSLGHPNGIVIQGIGGGLVPTLKRRTRGIELAGDHQIPLTVEPSDFGLGCPDNPELPMYGPPDEGEGTADNPHIVRAACDITDAVLKGETGPARNATVLCTAVILKAAGHAMTLAEGVDLAVKSIDEGAALGVLERLRA